MRCESEPVATVSLRYNERQVLIGDLVPERDPNLLDLCRDHVDRMTPPVGWTVDDARVVVAELATSRPPSRGSFAFGGWPGPGPPRVFSGLRLCPPVGVTASQAWGPWN